MKSQEQIEEMAGRAKVRSGWAGDGGAYVPIGDLPFEQDMDVATAAGHREFAEGVEAGMRWALGWASDPLE